MARSRYAGTQTVAGDRGTAYGTWTDPTAGNALGPDVLDGVRTVDHVTVAGDRLDLLAAKYLGDPGYWWVIALGNGIIDPFSVPVNTTLRIPTDARAILAKVAR